MTDFAALIICDDQQIPLSPVGSSGLDFVNYELDKFGFDENEALDSLVFQVLRNPKALIVHLQRIYFCYQHDLTDDLFGALVDFLIILEGKGRALSSRIVKGSKSKLTDEQYAFLTRALNVPTDQVKWLTGNMDSVFSRGLIGTPVLVLKAETKQEQVHDPLDIARDFIAYSQIDAALETLENALLLDFERQDLHDELLELYKLTKDADRFFKMYNVLSEQGKAVPAAWDEIKGFFNG